jgi:hypothetical protein
MTRTFEARYVLDGQGAQAPLGATVTLHLSSPAATLTVEVPLGAIDDEGKGPGIWAIDPKTSQVSFVLVNVARFGRETAILTKGAQPGLQIVAAGGHYLHEGERIQIVGERAAMR